MGVQVIEYSTEFRIKIPYDRLRKRNNAAVKKMPGVRFLGDAKCWSVPPQHRQAIGQFIKYTRAKYFKIDESPEKIGEVPPLKDLEMDVPLSHPEGFGFRPYQQNGVAQGLHFKRFLNGDEQGLGKTLQSIGTLHAAHLRGEDVFPALIVCPASTKINWQREWHMWTNYKAEILETRTKDTWHRFYEIGHAQVFIVNFESLKKYFVKRMPEKKKKGDKFHSKEIIFDPRKDLFKSIIVDESHRCKDPKTQQSKITAQLAVGKNYRICLSGTPVVNKPIDLATQLAIIGRLSHFGGYNGFLQRYCEGGTGAANLTELNYLLNRHCYFRREKIDVAKDLPAKSRQTILCDITNRREYNFARDEFLKHLRASDLNDKEIKKKMRAEILVKMGELKKLSALGKLEQVKAFTDEIMDSGNKLIIFAIHHVIVDALLELYPKAVTVTGRDNQDQKQVSIDKFQNDPNCQLIICNTKAAGVGITLTASSRVAFVEYPWTYSDCAQAEDRSHRIGQTEPVMCTYFLGSQTIDEKLYKMIQEKRHIGNTITGASDKMEMTTIDTMVDLFK